MPVIVTKVHGSRSEYVWVCPRGPIWCRNTEQLRPSYGVEEYLDLGQELIMPHENLSSGKTPKELSDSRVEEPGFGADLEGRTHHPDTGGHGSGKPNPRLPKGSEYEPHNLRKCKRSKRPPPQYR